MNFEQWWDEHDESKRFHAPRDARAAWEGAIAAEREACVDAIQRLIDGGLNCHAADCIEAIRLRGAAL